MTNQAVFLKKHKSIIIPAFIVVFALLFFVACTSESGIKNEVIAKSEPKIEVPVVKQNISLIEATSAKAIQDEEKSPKTVVIAFYKAIREKRFQEAFLMTNWKPAVEGLTKEEIADLQPDFENLSAMLESEQLVITGEQSGKENASVFIKSVDSETGKEKIDEIKLRREGATWLMLLGDEEAEKAVKAAGKNYFFELRIQTLEAQAGEMFERIAKAQVVYSLQNGGNFADLNALITANLVPEEIKNSKENGYKYSLTLSGDKKKYRVNAEPVIYGKTGRLSFLMQTEGDAGKPVLQKEDKKGKPLN